MLRLEGRRRLLPDVLSGAPMRGEVAAQETGARVGLVATLRAAGAELAYMERVTITRFASGSLNMAGVETVLVMHHRQQRLRSFDRGGRVHGVHHIAIIERGDCAWRRTTSHEGAADLVRIAVPALCHGWQESPPSSTASWRVKY